MQFERGQLVRVLDNRMYEDIPVGTVGIVHSDDGEILQVSFPFCTHSPGHHLNDHMRLMYKRRFEVIGEVSDG